MSGYQTYLVETFRNPGEPTDAKIRVRPLARQGVSTSLRVECNRNMRKRNPVGTIFRITAKLTSREGGTPFLYSHYSSNYDVLNRGDVVALIKRKKISSSAIHRLMYQ